MATPPDGSAQSRADDARAALWDPYDLSRGDNPFLETWNGSAFDAATWDEWRSAALRAGGSLAERGVGHGTRVAQLLTNDFPTSAALLGAWSTGATVLSLPLIPRGSSPLAYARLLRRVCRDAEVDLVVAEKAHVSALGQLELPVPVLSSNDLLDGTPRDPTPAPADGEMFVQYSSGSTSDPRGCTLTMEAIGAQLVRLAEALDADSSDRTVAWLPLSHDMGCFGCLLLSWFLGNPLRLSTPTRFLRRPATWMEDCAQFQASLSPAPSFALDLAARAARTSPPSRALGLRSVILGGERNEATTIELALDVLGGSGLKPNAITPAYGLAEGVLAVTMKPAGTIPTVIDVDREEILPGSSGRSRMVSCGVPLRDVQLSLGDSEGGPGVIRIDTPSSATRYLSDPAATASRFCEGSVLTEDLGLIRDGELYVIGRVDDVICIGGRNVHARDIEMTLTPALGVRAGNAVVVAVDDGPRPELVVVAEPDSVPMSTADLLTRTRMIAQAAFDAAGVRISRCVFLDRGTLPKTPSGKVRRRHCTDIARAGVQGTVVNV